MNLLYLSSFLPKRSETFVYREVLGLRARGHKVAIASLYQPDPALGDPALDELAAGAIVVYSGMRPLLRDALAFLASSPARGAAVLACAFGDALSADDLKSAARPKVLVQALAGLALARRAGGTGCRKLHVHMAHAAATVGMYAARALGIPFSFTGHAADLFRERCLLRKKLDRASFVACISEWHREWYRSIIHRPDADYPIMRCGVDVPETPFPVRDSGPLRILGLGRLVPKKGFDVLIRACAALHAAGLPVELTIAGDGPELAALQSLVGSLPCRFAGAVANRDVPALLAAADVFALPCRISPDGDRDGIPVVLMEAMAHGVCVVSGDLPTIRELVRDRVSGLMVPPGGVAPLDAALRELASDPALRARLAEGGRARVREEFSSQTNLARIESAFRNQP